MALPNPSHTNVAQICRVAPPSASPDHFLIPLTFFDIRWLRFPSVQRLYFYETSSSPNSKDPIFSFDSILENLKSSLSLTLQHFLPLAGNLTWPQDSLKPILSYVQGDTLSLTIAKSNADDFDRLSSNIHELLLAPQEYHPLVPQLETSHDKASVMALQITLFRNRGFSIGASTHHAVLDGLTSISFFKSWAHICKQKHLGMTSPPSLLLPDHLQPSYDRKLIEDKGELGSLFSKQYQEIEGPKNRSLKVWDNFQAPQQDSIIRGTFELTRASIQKLRAQVITSVTSNNDVTNLHVSTFSLACAYTWVCLVKAEETKEEEARLVFQADCRSRLDPSLPKTYFGNCVVACIAVAETKALKGGGEGLVVALRAITRAMKNLEEGVLNGAENWVSRIIGLRGSSRVVAIAGSHRFGVYDVDFGFGRPKKVELVSIDRTGAISFSDTKNGEGGVEVGLALKKDYMDAFASLLSRDI